MLLGFSSENYRLRAGLLVDGRAAEAILGDDGRWPIGGEAFDADLDEQLHDRLGGHRLERRPLTGDPRGGA
jgi:hypothetical protein